MIRLPILRFVLSVSMVALTSCEPLPMMGSVETLPDIVVVQNIDDTLPNDALPEFAWAQELHAALPELVPAGASLSLYVEDVEEGTTFSHRGGKPVYLASGIKLFFMVEAYRQRESGRISFDERIRYSWRDVRDGAPAMNRIKVGSRVELGDLLTYMIRDSDNAATDLVLRRLGLDNVLTGMEEQGIVTGGDIVNMLHVRREIYALLDPRARKLSSSKIRDIRWRDGHHPRLDLLRKHIGAPFGDYDEQDLERAYDEYYASGANHVALSDAGRILAKMHRRELVNEEASVEMLERLRAVWNSGSRIAGLLGDRASLVRHKTGTQRRRICDLALVPFEHGEPLVVTIAIEGPRHEEAEVVLRDVVQRIIELERSERARLRPRQGDLARAP